MDVGVRIPLVLSLVGVALSEAGVIAAHAGFAESLWQSGQQPLGPVYPGQLFAAGSRPTDVALADLDGDGALDLVVAISRARGVSLRAGRGDGTFGPERRLPDQVLPERVNLADFNGDDSIDILSSDEDGFTVWLNAGDGTFPESVRVNVWPDATDVGVADLTGDGVQDVVVVRNQNNFDIFEGDGTGDFRLLQTVHDTRRFESVALGDLDLDGDVDLALFNVRRSSLPGVVRYNDGRGRFDESQEIDGLPGDRVLAADIDGDGDLDLMGIERRFYSPNVPIVRNLGERMFADEDWILTGDATVTAFGVADINGDGLNDLLTAGLRFSSRVSDVLVFDGQADGTLAEPRGDVTAEYPSAVAIGDLNGDGLADAVIANEKSDDVGVLLARDPGRFASRQEFFVGDAPRGLAVADFTGDGHLDALTTEAIDDDLMLLPLPR